MASLDEILACQNRWVEALKSESAAAMMATNSLRSLKQAVELLQNRLQLVGYPDCSFSRPSPRQLESRIQRIENRTKVAIPAIVKTFWEIVGGISLIEYSDYRHVEFWENRHVFGKSEFCDGVHIDACSKDWEECVIYDFESLEEDDDTESFLYSMSPDGYHKDDISGGDPYCIGRNSQWGPTWENFSWTGPVRPKTAPHDPPDFLSYLRVAILECGGFPGLYGEPGYHDLCQELVEGLPVF